MAVVHRIIDRVIFIGLLVTIIVTAIPYGSVQPWWVAIFACLIFLLGILGAIDLLITRERLPVGASVAVPLLILCGFIVLQSLRVFAANNPVIPDLRLAISADPYSSQQVAMKLFALIVAGVLFLRYANSGSRLRLVVYVVIGVGVASALFGLVRAGTHTTSSWLFPLPDPARGFAQFVNRNHFGFLIEMTLGLTLGLVVGSRTALRKYLIFLPIAAFLWVALIISNTRGGIFTSLCQLLFLGILLDPFRRFGSRETAQAERGFHKLARGLVVRVFAAVALVVVFVVGVSWVGGERVTTNIELTSTAYDHPGLDPRENTRRKQIWSSTWQMFKAHPILGTGLGAYWIAITKFHDASGAFTPQEAHNDYLELLASGGLIGCALVIWFAFRVARVSRRLTKESGALSALAVGALVGMFGVLVHSFVDFGLHIPANALLFTILTTVLVNPAAFARA